MNGAGTRPSEAAVAQRALFQRPTCGPGRRDAECSDTLGTCMQLYHSHGVTIYRREARMKAHMYSSTHASVQMNNAA